MRWLVRAAAFLAAVIGLGMFFLTIAIGHCSAFGGTCPREGLNDDVLGTAGTGGALVGAGFVLMFTPAVRRIPRALLVAVGTGVVFALVAHAITSG